MTRIEKRIGNYHVQVYSDGKDWHYVVVNHETGWSTAGTKRTRGAALACALEAVQMKMNPKESIGLKALKNPAAFTKKGERMYEHVKRSGSARDPAAVVFAAAKRRPGTGLVKRKWAREHGYPRPNPEGENSAVKAFEDFHDYDANSVTRFKSGVPRVLPARMTLAGPCMWLTYKSDKWERPKRHDYIHKIDSFPRVKVALMDGEAGGRTVKVPEKVRHAKTVAQIGLAALGFAYENEDGEEIEAKAPRGSKWYWSQGARALYLIRGESKLIAVIWGGDLDVEPRGIVG